MIRRPYVFIFLILLLAELGLSAQKKDYVSTISSNNKEAYYGFLDEFPKSKFRFQVESMLEQLVFFDVKDSDSKIVLQSFTKEFPHSSNRDYILDKLKQIKEEEAFENARKEHRLSSYAQFLEAYPNSEYAEIIDTLSALLRLQDLVEKQIITRNSNINELADYKYLHNQDQYDTILEKLEQKLFEDFMRNPTKSICRKILLLNPWSLHRLEIWQYLENNPSDTASYYINLNKVSREKKEKETADQIFFAIIRERNDIDKPYLVFKSPDRVISKISDYTVSPVEDGWSYPEIIHLPPLKLFVMILSKNDAPNYREYGNMVLDFHRELADYQNIEAIESRLYLYYEESFVDKAFIEYLDNLK